MVQWLFPCFSPDHFRTHAPMNGAQHVQNLTNEQEKDEPHYHKSETITTFYANITISVHLSTLVHAHLHTRSNWINFWIHKHFTRSVYFGLEKGRWEAEKQREKSMKHACVSLRLVVLCTRDRHKLSDFLIKRSICTCVCFVWKKNKNRQHSKSSASSFDSFFSVNINILAYLFVIFMMRRHLLR